MVEELIVEDGVCNGVMTKTGAQYRAKAVVLTTGTYLRGKVIMGELLYESGPNNQQPSVKLSDDLRDLALNWFVSKRVHHRVFIRIRLILSKRKFSLVMRIRSFSHMKR